MSLTWPCIFWGQKSPYRDNEVIFWIFAYCPRSRVLHVTLTNPQAFGFESHLRSLPCTLRRQLVLKPVVL